MSIKPYNMNNPADRARWYKEMKSYLSLAGEDNFLIQGTDREGRKFAWEAFLTIGDEFSVNQKMCSHAVYQIRLETGKRGYSCTSEEDTAGGCCKDGDCPFETYGDIS